MKTEPGSLAGFYNTEFTASRKYRAHPVRSNSLGGDP